MSHHMTRALRFHTKSRRGCRTCKRRRVKCDLAVPCCGQCHKYGVSCDFEALPRTVPGPAKVAIARIGDLESRNITSVHVTQWQACRVPQPVTYPVYRGQDMQRGSHIGLEIELANFYEHYARSDNRPAAGYLPPGFSDSIRRFAFEHPTVMNGFLGICSTLLRLRSSSNTERYAQASLIFAGRCISGQVQVVRSGITASNFDAIYITSSLIATQAIMARQFLPLDNSEDLGPGVAQWLHVFRGSRSVAASSPELCVRSGIAVNFPTLHKPNPYLVEIEPPAINHALAFLLDGLDPSCTPQDEHDAYQHAIACMATTYHRGSWSLHYRFLLGAPRAFVQCVERGDPTALLIMAVFFRILQALQPPELFDASSQRDFDAIARHLRGVHRQLLRRALVILAVEEAAGFQIASTMEQCVVDVPRIGYDILYKY